MRLRNLLLASSVLVVSACAGLKAVDSENQDAVDAGDFPIPSDLKWETPYGLMNTKLDGPFFDNAMNTFTSQTEYETDVDHIKSIFIDERFLVPEFTDIFLDSVGSPFYNISNLYSDGRIKTMKRRLYMTVPTDSPARLFHKHFVQVECEGDVSALSQKPGFFLNDLFEMCQSGDITAIGHLLEMTQEEEDNEVSPVTTAAFMAPHGKPCTVTKAPGSFHIKGECIYTKVMGATLGDEWPIRTQTSDLKMIKQKDGKWMYQGKVTYNYNNVRVEADYDPNRKDMYIANDGQSELTWESANYFKETWDD